MRHLAILVVPLAALALSACIPVAIGAGLAGAYYYNSADRVYVDANPPAVVEAALAVMEEYSLAVVESGSSGLDGKVVAETARGEKVQVVVEREKDGLSELTVRVGLVDEDTAHEIAERIIAVLGQE